MTPGCARWASTCQTVGMNTGYFASFTLFLALNDAGFCNRQVASCLLPLPACRLAWLTCASGHLQRTTGPASCDWQVSRSSQLVMTRSPALLQGACGAGQQRTQMGVWTSLLRVGGATCLPVVPSKHRAAGG